MKQSKLTPERGSVVNEVAGASSHPSQVGAPARETSPKRGWIAAVALTIAVALATLTFYLIDGDSSPDSNQGTPVTAEYKEQMTRDLVNRGLIPRQSLEYNEQMMRDLVNRGLIPRQSLEG